MRKHKKALLGGIAAVLAVCLTVALAACGGTSSNAGSGSNGNTSNGNTSDASASSSDLNLVQDGKLTVVAELGFAPFEYIPDGQTEPVGFDVDVIKAVAQKMGLEATYLPNQQFDTLVPLIKQGGKADVAIAGITITDEREEEVDFSDPYLDSNQALVLKSDSSETEDSLNSSDKKIVCQAGTTGEDWIKENLPNATVVPIADVTAGMTGVQTGLYDAMVIDAPVASNQISQSFTDLKVAETIATGEQYGIAISKDNPALKDAVNKALKEMQDDGTMDQIKTQWFGTADI